MSIDLEKDTFFASKDIFEKINLKYTEEVKSNDLILEICSKEFKIDTFSKLSKGFNIKLQDENFNLSDLILENFSHINIKSGDKLVKSINIKNYIMTYTVINCANEIYKISIKLKNR
tara:strand:+ start:265 stop:615 length:351 start_codon:yes stop_codon:yes gene_type:complete